MPSRKNNRSVGPFGDSALLILMSLATGPKHGYALIEDIEEIAGISMGTATLYNALNRLENRGLVEALPEDDRRRPFKITAAGEVVMKEQLERLEKVTAAGRARLLLPLAYG